MAKDSKYLSGQKHEILHISKSFTGKNNDTIPAQLVYFLYFMMQANHGKVLRSNFYGVLSLLGYKRAAV